MNLKASQSAIRFIVRERIEEFRGFGGVRIEDDVIITETGLELMSIVPRQVALNRGTRILTLYCSEADMSSTVVSIFFAYIAYIKGRIKYVF